MSGLRGLCATFAMLGLVAPGVCGVGFAQSGNKRALLEDSFRIGDDGGALCQAQNSSADPAARTMFDRAWMLVCRDAARPIGQVYMLRSSGGDDAAVLLDRLAASRKATVTCDAARDAALPGLGAVSVRNCTASGSGYRIVSARRNGRLYVAQGQAIYASALDLALRTVIAGRPVPGKIDIVTTGAGSSAAFARLQATTLDAQSALAEGYRRNAAGNYAEAAEFFDSLFDRFAQSPEAAGLTPVERANRAHEYLINRALQLSNLGLRDQADAAFARAHAIVTADAVQLRLRRNFEAMHHINGQDLAGALAILDRPLSDGAALAEADRKSVV